MAPVHDTPDDGEHPSTDEPEIIADPYVIGPLRGAVPPAAAPPRAPSRRRSTLVTASLGIALVLSWGIGIGILVQRVFWPPTATASPVAAVAAGRSRPSPRAALPPPPSPSPRASGRGFVVPRATSTVERGPITVVDIGVSASSLADELARQRDAARDARETMLVMTTTSACSPCDSVFEALSDPRMETALSHVRLVRVFADVFKEDLDSLQIPRVNFPGFFVLGPDLRPRDGIDGGEWDADVPENMAPVLGSFVAGTLTKRRTPWQALPGAGMRL
jgi:hypothetical protein